MTMAAVDLNTFPERFRKAKADLKQALLKRDAAKKAWEDAQFAAQAAGQRLQVLRSELINAADAEDAADAEWWRV